MSVAIPSTIPLRRELEQAPATPAAEMAWMGVFVLLVLLALVAWRKRRNSSLLTGAKAAPGLLARWVKGIQLGSSRPIHLLSSSRLTSQHSVHEVLWQGRRLLIGCAPQSIELIAEAPDHQAGPLSTTVQPAEEAAP